MTTAKAALVSSMTEDQLLQAVIEALQLYGWLTHHDRRSDKALQQGNPGFPDVVAVHPKDGRLLFIECKSESGRPTGAQYQWLQALGKSLGPDRMTAGLWPSHLDEFIRHPFVTGKGL